MDRISKAIGTLAILLLSVFLTVVVQGWIALRGNVFDETGVIDHIKSLEKYNCGNLRAIIDATSKFQQYICEKETLTTLSEQLDQRLQEFKQNPGQLANNLLPIQNLLKTKADVNTRLKAMEEERSVVIIPFYPKPYMFLYTGPCATLLWLLFLIHPVPEQQNKDQQKKNDGNSEHNNPSAAKPKWKWKALWKAISVKPAWDFILKSRSSIFGGVIGGVVIYAVWGSPTLLRHWLATTTHGNPVDRKVFAFANSDTNWKSLLTQELIFLFVCCLLAACWLIWMKSSRNIQGKISSADLKTRAELLHGLYVRWIFCSLVLGLGFFCFTSFYWNIVQTYKDYRYVASAILSHLFWGLSWVLMSMPLGRAWQAWEEKRLEIISDRIQISAQSSPDTILKLLSELEPIGRLRLVGSGIAVVIAFIGPLFQFLTK